MEYGLIGERLGHSYSLNVGIRIGDVIKKIGTVDIGSFTDYKKAILNYQPQDIVTVTLERPGRDGYTEMSYEVTLEELK